MSSTLTTALTLHNQGISVLPVRADGTKIPAGLWKHLQTTPAPEHEVRAWFQEGSTLGLGVITGAVSGNLELIELEGRAAGKLTELRDLAHASGLGGLWSRLMDGWWEVSPSGGHHWFYRVTEPIPGNTKLAQAANRETLAETRGEGGYAVVAPTAGTVHHTGKPWVLVRHDHIPTLTPTERESLHTLFATLDEREPEAPHTELDQAFQQQAPTQRPDGMITPGDDYENKTDWADILTPHGWELVFRRGNTRYWRRPGKTDPGFSATTGHAGDRDRLYVFTTSTVFDAETPYTKFGAHAVLNHAGDHSAAAKQLAADGYGVRPPAPTITERTAERHLHLVPPTPVPATNGNNALAPVHTPNPDTDPKITLTDIGNTELLIQRHGHHLRYAPTRGKWLNWDGARWAWQEDDGTTMTAAIETINAITPQTDADRTHKHRSLNRKALENMIALARRDPRIRVTADQLDAHPWELNTPGGIINLRTGQLTPNDPTRLHTRITTTTPDFTADTTLWDQFLTQTFPDPQLAGYMQRLTGYSAIGKVREHILPFAHGGGGNGKGVFLEAIAGILGDYATTSPNRFLMAGRDQHETEVARLAGVRMVVCSEVNQDARFDEEKVKLLTGGDKLTARFMRQDHFTFPPTHTLWLMGNHQPRVAAGGHSFWRRLRLIPFTHTVPDHAIIEDLQSILATEHGPAILAWVAQGAAEYARHGLQEPDSVKAATAEYAQEEDALGRFITDYTNIGGGPAARVDTVTMRKAYTAWCRLQHETELSPQLFGRELRTRFDIDQARSSGRRYYTNVTLLDTTDITGEEPVEHWADR